MPTTETVMGLAVVKEESVTAPASGVGRRKKPLSALRLKRTGSRLVTITEKNVDGNFPTIIVVSCVVYLYESSLASLAVPCHIKASKNSMQLL
jgi:hypothetical protein